LFMDQWRNIEKIKSKTDSDVKSTSDTTATDDYGLDDD